MNIFNEIEFKIKSFLNLFKKQNNFKEIDKIGKYYHNLAKNPPKINKKIK